MEKCMVQNKTFSLWELEEWQTIASLIPRLNPATSQVGFVGAFSRFGFYFNQIVQVGSCRYHHHPTV